jgi:hypothetical protein
MSIVLLATDKSKTFLHAWSGNGAKPLLLSNIACFYKTSSTYRTWQFKSSRLSGVKLEIAISMLNGH